MSVAERVVLFAEISVHAASEDGEQLSVSATEAVADSTWEASKDYAEVNVGEVQAARTTAGVTKANAEDADAEAAESAIGETAPDAAPEERSRGVDVNAVQTVKAGVTEAPKAPEELMASMTPINQAVAAVGNFPETTEEAGGEAVATSSDDSTQPLVLAEREVIMLGGKLSSPEKKSASKELNTASDKDASKFAASTIHVAYDSAAAPEAAKMEEKVGELVNVLREADHAVPEELLKFGTYAGKEATFDKATFDEEAVSSFVLKNKLSLVITFCHETGPSICKGCVNAAEVAPKVEAKGVSAPATEEAKPEVKKSELVIMVDAGSAAPEEEPAVDEAKLAGMIAKVEGRVEDPVKGQTVAVTAGTVGAKVGVTAVAQLCGPFLSIEWSRRAMLVWLGDFSSCVVAIKDNFG
jgi:hypothetical protein